MISFLIAVVLTCSFASAQMMQSITNSKAAAAAAAPTYTGQNCTGGSSTGPNSASTCSATMTVSTGDEIIAFGTVGDQTSTLSSCSSATGSASVTWTVVTAASNQPDPSNNEAEGLCVGNVTSGGTVAPQLNWSVSGGDASIVAAAYSGSSSHATDGGTAREIGATGTNGVTPGTITTTTNNDLLFGGTADTSGNSATITAGTTSVTFTKRVCTTVWGGQTCLEDGAQTTAGAGTTAAWTYSVADHTLTAIVALKP